MLHPPLDLLTRQAFPELARALRERGGPILSEWESAVRQVLPSADEMTFSQLRDTFPGLLQQIVNTLASDVGHSPEVLLPASVEHGGHRFHQSYNLNEVLIEYTLLRHIAKQQVSSELGRQLTNEEGGALDLGIDTAARQSAVAFADHQTRQLRAATESQSKYLSFLSHDLRGGLNGIFLMVEVLRRELANRPELAETLADLEMMRRSIMETVGTMDRFLHAERFRKGKVQVKPGRVDLNQLVAEIAAHFAYQAKDKGLELRIEARDPCEIMSDRELLSLILQNLVSNAVKYTKQGQVRIGVQRDQPGHDCRIHVTDDGPGIPADKLTNLFESFTRGPTHGEQGVGLGLSIAHQAAQLLGAKLWAESTPGQGSIFYVAVRELTPATGAS